MRKISRKDFLFLLISSAFLAIGYRFSSKIFDISKDLKIKLSSIKNERLKKQILSFSLNNSSNVKKLSRDEELKEGLSFWYENKLHSFSDVDINK